MVEGALWGGLAVTGIGNWIVRSCLLLLLVVGLSACGDSAPRTVVEQALQYQIAHVDKADNPLVGHELLERRTNIRSVKVQSQKSTKISADDSVYPAVDVRGTYTLTIRQPQRKARYKRTEPFSLTLAHLEDPEANLDRWVLARTSETRGDRQQPNWQLVEFLPTPEPPPAEPDTAPIPQDLSSDPEPTTNDQ